MKKKGKRRDNRRKVLDQAITPRHVLWLIAIMALCLVAVLEVAAVSLTAVQIWRSPIPRVMRDLTIAIVAEHKAGDEVPIDYDYLGGQAYSPIAAWGLKTNSKWIARYVMKIVPQFQYDLVAPQGVYPEQAIFIFFPNAQSFHLGGFANLRFKALFLNERYAIDARWNDSRNALATLVHELIHLHRGNFVQDSEIEQEAHTQAATLEILAAMCNYGDELACGAFWSDIASYARASVRTTLHEIHAGWLYDPLANLLWRDVSDEAAARKANRYWESNKAEREGIIRRYQAYPWNQYILPGLWGTKLNTGHRVLVPIGTSSYYVKELGMPFDDTADLMGLFLRLLALIR